MTIRHAINILYVMQKWRRAEGEYAKVPCEMPFTPKEFGEAIDVAIQSLKAEVNRKAHSAD